MPKGRIGLSLSEDVLKILRRFGRSQLGDTNGMRPTRTEIIEDAVRVWHAHPYLRFTVLSVDQANGGPVKRTTAPTSEPAPDAETVAKEERPIDERIDDFIEADAAFGESSIAAQAKAREAKKATKASRKAATQKAVSEALPAETEKPMPERSGILSSDICTHPARERRGKRCLGCGTSF